MNGCTKSPWDFAVVDSAHQHIIVVCKSGPVSLSMHPPHLPTKKQPKRTRTPKENRGGEENMENCWNPLYLA